MSCMRDGEREESDSPQNADTSANSARASPPSHLLTRPSQRGLGELNFRPSNLNKRRNSRRTENGHRSNGPLNVRKIKKSKSDQDQLFFDQEVGTTQREIFLFSFSLEEACSDKPPSHSRKSESVV